MSTITKEFAQDIIRGHGYGVAPSAVEALARIALASLEARSRKLFTCSACGAEGLDEPLESKCHCNEDGAHWIESVVYTAPPAPVADLLLSELLGIAKRAADEADECAHAEFSDDSMEHSAAIADWERRAAMLQGAEPVTTAYKLPFEQWLSQQTDTIDVKCGCVMTEVFFHWLRVAYEAGNYQVIQGGWVSCSERMPEGMTDVHISNGHDVGQGWWDGDTWQTQHDYYSVPGEVTHWQPLPSPPVK